MKGIKKQNLPNKVCVVCNRSFAWRKKWEKVWEEVKYCSEACKKHKKNEKLTPDSRRSIE